MIPIISCPDCSTFPELRFKLSFAFLRNLLVKSDPGEFLLVKEVLKKIEEVLGLTLSR